MAPTRQVVKRSKEGRSASGESQRLPYALLDIADELRSQWDEYTPRSKVLHAALWAGLAVMRNEKWERWRVYAICDDRQDLPSKERP